MHTTVNRGGLSVSGVARLYPSAEALQAVSFDIAPGTVAAILGPSGAGKSTLLNVIAGLDRPTAGSVVLDGVDLASLPDRELVALRRERIGVVFQYANLLPMLTVEENALLPLALACREPDALWLEDVFAAVGLEGRRHDRPAALSSGERRRAVIARALVGRPALLLADEPTGGLDAPAAAQVLSVLDDVAAQLGPTVVITTNDPRAAESAEQVFVLHDGRVVEVSALRSRVPPLGSHTRKGV
jgi:putative ABC transport system ATP-binding protein